MFSGSRVWKNLQFYCTQCLHGDAFCVNNNNWLNVVYISLVWENHRHKNFVIFVVRLIEITINSVRFGSVIFMVYRIIILDVIGYSRSWYENRNSRGFPALSNKTKTHCASCFIIQLIRRNSPSSFRLLALSTLYADFRETPSYLWIKLRIWQSTENSPDANKQVNWQTSFKGVNICCQKSSQRRQKSQKKLVCENN